MGTGDKKTILIIDDEEYLRYTLGEFLADMGYDVLEAENGINGLEIFEKEQPDLVLCDLKMPVMGGLEVLYAISEKKLNIPIIIVSGAGSLEDTVQTLRLGAWDYLIKPVQNMNVLLHAVNKAFERAKLIEDRETYQRDLEKANRDLRDSLGMLEETRDQLVQSEKMAALGELVAGVAHEINTPVGIAVTAASFLEVKTSELEKIYRSGELKKNELESYFNDVQEVAQSLSLNMERAARLIASFKQMAVDQSCENMRRFNFSQYINETIISLKPSYKDSPYEIKVDCGKDIELNSFPGAFSQIINNMVMNSLLHGFGEMETGIMQIRVCQEKDSIVFIYEDNGKGMTKEQAEKVFHPFFTTKRGRGGTGLGMSIVFNLVTQTLKGHIVCSSSPGNGVRFTIRTLRDLSAD